MKKIKNLTFITLVFLAFGCNDAIDIDQPGRLNPLVAFQTIGDLQQGLLAIQDEIDSTHEIALASNLCDEIARGISNGGQGIDIYNFNINTQSDTDIFWVRNFRINQRANVFIDAANLFTPAASDQAQFNNILGQVRAIRAYANFELLQYYSPDLTNNSALGVPVIDFVPLLSIQPTRATVGECLAFINSDLDFAQSNITQQANPIQISRDFVTALRARIAAATGDQATAGTLAQQLLTSYPIANRTQYQLMFLDADNTEIIFKADRVLNDNYDRQGNTGSINGEVNVARPGVTLSRSGWAGARFSFVSTNAVSGGLYFEMDRGLFNLLNPADIRFAVNVAPSSVINPNYVADNNQAIDVISINKYPGSSGRPLMNDLKIFRSSEMLFILAESRAFAGNFNGASNSTAALIKQLRDARFGSNQPLPVYASQAEALGAILDEKRIEFAFEGHRYRDLKRIGVQANRGIQRDPTDCLQFESSACSLPASDFRLRSLPIPQIEINGNPGIAAQQNPGY